jgi:hypothetical protein
MEIENISITIPETICSICKRKIEEGKPFCYECMKCDKCSPDCFQAELENSEDELSSKQEVSNG